VLNVYAPIYDSISLIIGIALTIGALQELHWEFSVEWVVILGAVTFFVSVFTTGYAKVHGVQLMTIDLVLLGVVQMVLLRSATRVLRGELLMDPANRSEICLYA